MVPSLVSPFTNTVTAADADTCVRAGKEHRDGRQPVVKTTANRKLNDRCRLAAELLVTP